MTDTTLPVLLVLLSCGVIMGQILICNHLQNKVERLQNELEIERASHGYYRNMYAKLSASKGKDTTLRSESE